MDGEGHRQTPYRNYLLPINPNLEQAKCEDSVEGAWPIVEPTPVPQADNALLADQPTEIQPEDMPNSVPNQHELVDPELTTSATPGPAKNRSQASQNQPAPLRQSAWTTKNQLPLRYWNFALQWNNTPPSAFNTWDGLQTCLHLMVGLYNIFWRAQYEVTLLRPSQICKTQAISGMDGDPIDVVSMVDFWMREWTKGYLVWVQLPHLGNPKGQLLIEALCVSGQYNPEDDVQGKIIQ